MSISFIVTRYNTWNEQYERDRPLVHISVIATDSEHRLDCYELLSKKSARDVAVTMSPLSRTSEFLSHSFPRSLVLESYVRFCGGPGRCVANISCDVTKFGDYEQLCTAFNQQVLEWRCSRYCLLNFAVDCTFVA